MVVVVTIVGMVVGESVVVGFSIVKKDVDEVADDDSEEDCTACDDVDVSTLKV